MKPCCIIGYKNFSASRTEDVINGICEEVLNAVDDGYTHFISGFDGVIELLFAAVVSELKTDNQNIKLEAVLAYRGQIGSTDNEFQRLIQCCDFIYVHSEVYSDQCYQKRNQFIIEQSERVIVVKSNQYGTKNAIAIRHARTLKRNVRILKI